jgi:hypothetical protein
MFGLGPAELVILAGMGAVIALVVLVVVRMAQKSSANNPPFDSSKLTTCTACGRAISREAAACPQCGHPNQPQPPIRA